MIFENNYFSYVCIGLQEVIVTVGGEDDKVVLRSVECFDFSTHLWSTLACLPFAISKHGLVVSGEIFIFHLNINFLKNFYFSI